MRIFSYLDHLGALADMDLRRVLRPNRRAGGNHCISHDLPPTDRLRSNTCDEVATWVSRFLSSPMYPDGSFHQNRIRLKFGWAVPIGVLFVISFPPVRSLSSLNRLTSSARLL